MKVQNYRAQSKEIQEKNAMNLKKNKKQYMEGLERRKDNGEMML